MRVDEEFRIGRANRLGVAAGLTKTIGRTSTVDGSLTLEMGGAVPQLKDASFTVDISTLTSNQRMRDRRIQGEWLESSRFPLQRSTLPKSRALPLLTARAMK